MTGTRIAAVCRRPRRHGAGDRAGRRPVPVARPGRARGRAGRPAAAAHRRPADRRPAPFAAVDARLELRPARRTRSGGAAPGLGFRRPVHRDRGGGGAGRLAAGGRPAPSRPSWPGSPTRACWSRSRSRAGLATAPWRPSASTASSGSTDAGESVEALSRHLGWCLAEQRCPRGRVPRRSSVPGGPRSIRSPTSCAAALRLGGRSMLGRRAEAYRLAIDVGRTELHPRHARRVAAALRAGGRAGRRDDRAAAAPCAAPRAPRSPDISATRRCGCAGPRPTRRVRAGDRAGAAGDLARAAELINRGPG